MNVHDILNEKGLFIEIYKQRKDIEDLIWETNIEYGYEDRLISEIDGLIYNTYTGVLSLYETKGNPSERALAKARWQLNTHENVYVPHCFEYKNEISEIHKYLITKRNKHNIQIIEMR